MNFERNQVEEEKQNIIYHRNNTELDQKLLKRRNSTSYSSTFSDEIESIDRLQQIDSSKPKIMGPILPVLEVLAKSNEDGWYYKGKIKEPIGNNKYKLEDCSGKIEVVMKEDILFHSKMDTWVVGDPCVAMHPQYEFSYAPGQIVEVSHDNKRILVRFYDYAESVVSEEEVYKLSRAKFQTDVNMIIKLERRWVGQVVVARNELNRTYAYGKPIGFACSIFF